jgi:hypothetical protein
MPHQRFDIGSKWLLHNQGKGALLVGGFMDVRRIEPMPGEIVQNRKYPDGLLRVYLNGERRPHHVLIEVATYPEERALQQALDDLTLSYQTLGHLPELLMLILRPKGRFRIVGRHEVRSKRGLSRLEAEWKPVELWTLPATDFLATGDVGVTPWVPLMDFDGPPESLLERCAEKIEREAHPKDRSDLLAVSQVLGGLKFPLPLLDEIFGGQEAMFESPVLQLFVAKRFHEAILNLLKDRFDTVPRNVTKPLREIIDEKKLHQLIVLAAKCPNLEVFREALLS